MIPARGFSLVELLVAMTICAVISAGIAAVVPPARAAFEKTPAEIDLQQRARTAIDVIAQAIRAAGADAVAAAELGPLSRVVPAVVPVASDGAFTRLKVLGPRLNAAQGVLDHHQAGSTGPLVLAAHPCPSAPVVCGFARDATALIADGSGRFDVFVVGSADAATRAITSRRPLSPPYAAGSVVVEADVHTFQLDAQPDGSQTLVRVTGAGAVQPIVDRVSALTFEFYARDHAGGLERLPVESLNDGPWWRGGPDGDYDDDLFRVRQVDIVIGLRAAAPSSTARTFRFAVFLRNAP